MAWAFHIVGIIESKTVKHLHIVGVSLSLYIVEVSLSLYHCDFIIMIILFKELKIKKEAGFMKYVDNAPLSGALLISRNEPCFSASIQLLPCHGLNPCSSTSVTLVWKKCVALCAVFGVWSWVSSLNHTILCTSESMIRPLCLYLVQLFSLWAQTH